MEKNEKNLVLSKKIEQMKELMRGLRLNKASIDMND